MPVLNPLLPLQFLVKMGINQGYLFAFLLVSLFASYTSNCPTPDPTSPYDGSTYHECAKLYSAIENALLESPGSLYKVYNNFFPSSGSEPTYVLVNVYLHKLNDSGVFSACWTSSAVLKSVAPTVLASLQPNLLSLLLQTVGASELTTELVYGEQLFLNFTISDWYSDLTTLGVVQDFTLLVRAIEDLFIECYKIRAHSASSKGPRNMTHMRSHTPFISKCV